MTRSLLPLAAMLLATPVLAQDIPADIMAFAETIGLEEVRWHPGREQADLDGILGGTPVELDFHRDGALEEIEGRHDGLFDAALVEPVLPQALIQSADYPKGAQLTKVELKEDEYELEGRTAEGAWFEAKYRRDGTLEKWERK